MQREALFRLLMGDRFIVRSFKSAGTIYPLSQRLRPVVGEYQHSMVSRSKQQEEQFIENRDDLHCVPDELRKCFSLFLSEFRT
jgi:hypothetical protein